MLGCNTCWLLWLNILHELDNPFSGILCLHAVGFVLTNDVCVFTDADFV